MSIMEQGPYPSGRVPGQQTPIPRAAAIAGILFSVLLGTTLVLLRVSVSESVTEPPGTSAIDTGRVALALHLVPFVGIAFLWFIGVLCHRLGASEDRFFATVVIGSGTLFLAMLFVAAAVAGVTIMGLAVLPNQRIEVGAYLFGRALSAQIMNVFALKMAGVFMISTATLAIRTRILPRWITLPGYGVATLLLLSTRFANWLPLAFPLWVFILSLYILVENLLAKPETAA